MDMKDKKIAVVVGGPSTEADVSRRTGAAIAGALQQKGYTAQVLELVRNTLPKTSRQAATTSSSTPSTAVTVKTVSSRGCAK